MSDGHKQVYTYINIGDYDVLQKISRKYGLSVSDVVRVGIRMAIQYENKIDFNNIVNEKKNSRKKIIESEISYDIEDRDGLPDNCSFFEGNTY